MKHLPAYFHHFDPFRNPKCSPLNCKFEILTELRETAKPRKYIAQRINISLLKNWLYI